MPMSTGRNYFGSSRAPSLPEPQNSLYRQKESFESALTAALTESDFDPLSRLRLDVADARESARSIVFRHISTQPIQITEIKEDGKETASYDIVTECSFRPNSSFEDGGSVCNFAFNLLDEQGFELPVAIHRLITEPQGTDIAATVADVVQEVGDATEEWRQLLSKPALYPNTKQLVALCTSVARKCRQENPGVKGMIRRIGAPEAVNELIRVEVGKHPQVHSFYEGMNAEIESLDWELHNPPKFDRIVGHSLIFKVKGAYRTSNKANPLC